MPPPVGWVQIWRQVAGVCDPRVLGELVSGKPLMCLPSPLSCTAAWAMFAGSPNMHAPGLWSASCSGNKHIGAGKLVPLLAPLLPSPLPTVPLVPPVPVLQPHPQHR